MVPSQGFGPNLGSSIRGPGGQASGGQGARHQGPGGQASGGAGGPAPGGPGNQASGGPGKQAQASPGAMFLGCKGCQDAKGVFYERQFVLEYFQSFGYCVSGAG